MSDTSLHSILKDDFVLKLYMMPILNNSVTLDSSFEISTSKFPAQPIFNAGFHYYIHQSYELFEKIIEKLGGKTFYWAINGFETLLSSQEYKYELLDKSAMYLDTTRKEIESLRNQSMFYQMWEILMIFNIMNKNVNMNINTIKYKQEIEKATEFYKLKFANNISLTFGTKTCNLGVICIDEYETLLDQEATSFVSLLEKYVDILAKMENSGSLIIKLNDVFTLPTLKLIQLCKALFDNVYIYKPHYSRATDSDKYLVCLNFEEKSYKSIKKKLEACVAKMDQKDKFVIDFMSDISVSPKLMTTISYINNILCGIQHRTKNRIMKYINSDDYFGNEYQEAVQHQLNCVEHFFANFYPINNNDYSDLQKKYTKTIKENNFAITKYYTSEN
jgi:hypothetical protein